MADRRREANVHGRRALNVPLLRRMLAGVGLLTILAMVTGGATGRAEIVSTAAAFFALAVALVTVASNFSIWNRGATSDIRANALRAYGSLRRNALISAVTYAWGALAMQGLYLTPLTGLKWQHGWQYAAAMALLAAGSMLFLRLLAPPLPRASPDLWRRSVRLSGAIALLQGLGAAGGLAFLTVSGKLASMRPDWAANRVFAALAVAILAVAIAALVSLKRTEPHA